LQKSWLGNEEMLVMNPKRERAKAVDGIKSVLQFRNKDRGKWQVVFANAVLLVDAASAA
jgi:hypothetical protein